MYNAQSRGCEVRTILEGASQTYFVYDRVFASADFFVDMEIVHGLARSSLSGQMRS